MKPNKLILLAMWSLIFSLSTAFAQVPTQTIRGSVVDAETNFPLEGVTVAIIELDGKTKGTNSDGKGKFRIEGVKVGRVKIVFQYIGYQTANLDNIEVTSAKEVILAQKLESSAVEIEAVELVATRNGEVTNEMSTISGREFSVTETDLYAGSRGEPARMARNYAGVVSGDDSRNDIIVRGNSPNALLWKLEGFNIPNPNHFAIPGTGGGPVTILNNKFLANSDFYTGAFPAEYGNSVGGVFDLRMRNGNDEKFEFTGQLGLLGTELTAEGPISKESGSSFLVMYRYSTLALFEFLNLNLGTDAIPNYQDGAFRLNFPQKNGAQLSLWGIGGLSNINIVFSDQLAPPDEIDIFTDNQDRDQFFASNTGIAGLTYTYPININTYVKAGVGISRQFNDTYHEQIYRVLGPDSTYIQDSLQLTPILDYSYDEIKYSAFAKYSQKISRNHTINAGFNFDWFNSSYDDRVRIVQPQEQGPPNFTPWTVRWQGRINAPLFQPYVQYKYKPNDKFQMVAGLTSLYFGINNNSFSPIEPRLGANYELSKKSKLSFGAGLHSQYQTPYLYFYGTPTPNNGEDLVDEYNIDMGLTKSGHIVLGYDFLPSKFMRFRTEVYYQHLYNIPVDTFPSSFSMVNAGSGFSRLFPGELVNDGTGRNFGIEFSLERFFSGGYYFLMTGSLFDSKYRGSDGVLRNTTFNGSYQGNIVAAKEFKINDRSTLTFGAKVVSVGGRWTGPVDTEASAAQLEIVFVDSTFNTERFPPYFRADANLTWAVNRNNVTHKLAIDLINIPNLFGVQNILTLTYVPEAPDPVREEYNLGFFPVFYYRIDF
ncbi:MAG: carboxypeptidase-like regulatory domain-containing protein [Bacteroidia bacterium]|nr:carboxypeptidase-like regulatory domain-containing protein [Bacteroidia bacterium]